MPFARTAQSLDTQPRKDNTKIFLLGAINENSHGHKLRLERVVQIIEQRQQPVVVMKQFDRENQTFLDLALPRFQDVDCVVSKAATPGWEWRFYKPFVQLVLNKKVAQVAAKLSYIDVRNVMTDGFSAVMIETYKLKQISLQLLSAQNKAIKEGHCNMLSAKALVHMDQGQIARDVWMASFVNGVSNKTAC